MHTTFILDYKRTRINIKLQFKYAKLMNLSAKYQYNSVCIEKLNLVYILIS